MAGLKLFTHGSTTVLAHSYGSTVTGLALQNGLDVDNVVVFGSPGMATGNIDGLNLPAGTHFYALRAKGDYVSYSRNFGTDPADPAFGGTRLSTGDSVSGHSKYYLPKSESLKNIVAVVNGRPEALTTAGTSLRDEGGWPVVERGLIDDINRRTNEIQKTLAATAIGGIKDAAGNIVADLKDAAHAAGVAADAATAAAQVAQEAATEAARVAGDAVTDTARAAAQATAEAAAAAARTAQEAARAAGNVAEAVAGEVGKNADALGDAAGDAARAVGAGARSIWDGLTP